MDVFETPPEPRFKSQSEHRRGEAASGGFEKLRQSFTKDLARCVILEHFSGLLFGYRFLSCSDPKLNLADCNRIAVTGLRGPVAPAHRSESESPRGDLSSASDCRQSVLWPS